MHPSFLLSAFVVAALAVVTTIALALAVLSKSDRFRYLTIAILSLLLLVVVVYATGVANPTSNVVRAIAKALQRRDTAIILSMLSGIFVGASVSTAFLSLKNATNRLGTSIFLIAAVLSATFTMVGNSNSSVSAVAKPASKNIGGVTDDIVVEEICKCSFYPIRVAAQGDDVYYAGVTDLIAWTGVVVRLSPNANGNGYEETIIARGIDRPCGIAIDGDRILLSRSGQWHRATEGVLVAQSTGTVSELRDFDGDGIIDHIKDIIEELPGARSPETQHQNSAIAVGEDGRIYVSQGVRTDNTFDPDEWAGTVMVTDADGTNRRVYASGFRNPFGLCFGPQGKLYCTDNDPDKNPDGEELNLVIEGSHYGFPMSHGDAPAPTGTARPIAIYNKGDLQGMTYSNSPALPAAYRDCLYIASSGSGRILRAQVKNADASDSAPTAEFFEFANVPNPLDVTAADNGVLFACSFADKTIYKISVEAENN